MKTVSREELQAVVDEIPHADLGGSPVRAWVLAAALGLNERQVYHRVRLLRKVGVVRVDSSGSRVDIPLLSSVHGYIFSADPEDNRGFRYTRLKGNLTSLQQTYNEAAERFIKTLPAAEQAVARRSIARLLERLIEDISDAVTVNAPVPVSSGI